LFTASDYLPGVDSAAIDAPRPARLLQARASTVVTVAVGLVAAAPIAIYLWIALHRVGYGYELDWMEGGSVELAARIAHGQSLYVAPSLSFVGWAYTPFYYLLAAAVAKLTGLGFVPLRLVSLLASLGSMATLALIVTRETSDRVAGLVAAGLFAATYVLTGSWFDIGRVDSLFLALTLAALAYGRWAKGVHGGIALGMLAFLAFFTKQSALFAVVPALAYLAAVRWRTGVPALATLATLVVASTLILNATSHGWYLYYIYGELLHQPVVPQLWVQFWTKDILHHLWPLAILVVGGGAVLLWRERALPTKNAVYWVVAAAGLLGSAWVSRLHSGGYLNVLLPAYAAAALLAGLVYGALVRGRYGAVARPVLAAVLIVQLAMLAYPIGPQIPTVYDRAVGAQLIARLRALPGKVIVLRHPWYATMAGKTTSGQEEALSDVLRSADPRGATALRASLRNALNAQNIDAVVIDFPSDVRFFGPELTRYFRLEKRPITTSPLYPLTDLGSAPTLVYVRVRPAR
jgi:hypothetical protein